MATIKRTIEEKAKAYDEARKVAENIHRFSSDLDEIKRMEQLFPELKEREDERMRNAAINACKYMVDNFENSTKQYEDAIAWLEKQGEQTISNHIQMGKRYKCIDIPRYTCFQKGNIYKPEDAFLCSLMNLCYDCFDLVNEKEEQDKQDSLVFPKYKTGDILTDGKSKYNVLSWDYTEKGTPAYYMEGNGCKFSWGCKDADEKLTKVDEQKPNYCHHEVDLEKETDRWYNNEASKEFENVLYKDIEKCAKHFFELGLKAQNKTTPLQQQRISVMKMEFWTGLQTFNESEMTLSDAYNKGIEDVLEELELKAQKG